MKNIKKYALNIKALALVVLLVMQFIVLSQLTGDVNKSPDALARTVPLNQFTYEDQANYLIDKFESYSTSSTDSSIEFNGILSTGIFEADNISDDQEKVEKKISTRYDLSTNKFMVDIKLYQGETLTESWSEEVEPLYDDEKDEGYIEFENERYYLSECLKTDVIDDCVAATATVGTVGVIAAAALVITIVVTPPSVHQKIIRTISTVTEKIVQAVKSFWGWFTRWIKKIFTRTYTVTKTTVVTTYTPTLMIDGEKVDTKEVSLTDIKKKELYPENRFYLCFVSTKIYMSINPISDSAAVAILKTGIVVKDQNTGKEMLASTFTRLGVDAYNVATLAGINPRTPFGHPEYEHGAYHYHSNVLVKVNGKNHSPHSFFLIL